LAEGFASSDLSQRPTPPSAYPGMELSVEEMSGKQDLVSGETDVNSIKRDFPQDVKPTRVCWVGGRFTRKYWRYCKGVAALCFLMLLPLLAHDYLYLTRWKDQAVEKFSVRHLNISLPEQKEEASLGTVEGDFKLAFKSKFLITGATSPLCRVTAQIWR